METDVHSGQSLLDEQNEWFREQYRFTPSSARACPYIVAGKRCRVGVSDTCLCQQFYHRPLDHARLWRDKGGQYVLTAEPYDFDAASAEYLAFVEAMAAIGLSVTTSVDSAWCPDHTTLLVIRRITSA